AHPMPWQALLGDRGRVIGMETFGESAPGPALYEHFGFTPEAVVAWAETLQPAPGTASLAPGRR
ncbi:hypothetical protein DFR31_2599, partial [Alkalispirillum mobile]